MKFLYVFSPVPKRTTVQLRHTNLKSHIPGTRRDATTS